MLRFPDVGVVASVMTRIRGLIVFLVLTLAQACAWAQELRPHSILVLDQAELRGPFYDLLFSGLRDVVVGHTHSNVTLYGENLDLSRFGGQAYEQNLKRFLHEKYRDKPIGAVVAIGGASLECALRWREELWPGIPIVFAMVDELDFTRLKPPPDVTGVIVKTPLAELDQGCARSGARPGHGGDCRRPLGSSRRFPQLG